MGLTGNQGVEKFAGHIWPHFFCVHIKMHWFFLGGIKATMASIIFENMLPSTYHCTTVHHSLFNLIPHSCHSQYDLAIAAVGHLAPAVGLLHLAPCSNCSRLSFCRSWSPSPSSSCSGSSSCCSWSPSPSSCCSGSSSYCSWSPPLSSCCRWHCWSS